MKQLRILVVILFFIPAALLAQEITYSEFNNEDNRDINFEILGKMNNGYIIYKNVNARHVLAVYDDQMHITKTVRLGFVPDKTFNIDFIAYPDYFFMIYQYQKNKIVYCMGIKMDAQGTKLGEPVVLDTSRVPILADNRIYGTTYSQDKQKIMIYKMQKKNQTLNIVTKLFDKDMKMLDSTRILNNFDERRELYTDMLVDNDGGHFFAKETKGIFNDNIDGLFIYCRKPGAKDYKITNVDLKGKYVDEVKIKIDNLNKRYILNSLYYVQQRGNIKGLFTLLLDAASMDTVRSAFNLFPDSIRTNINTDGIFRAAFDNLLIRHTIVKKDGGFILSSEGFSFLTRSSNNGWNRSNYLFNSPYYSASDYYLSNPGYNYYRPYNSYSNYQTTTYYCEDILIMSLDKNLNMKWNTIIPKSQTDDDNENYLSFSTMNVGGEIRFLYNEVDKNRQIISNQSVLPDGELKRYPTLKSREAGYEFMPRHAKQVGIREVIIPCIYRTNIAFAKVIFPE